MAIPSARPKASRSTRKSICSSTRAAATSARRAAPRRRSCSSSIETGKYVKEWGQNAYGFSFAHAIRFDKEDNLWVVDEGSNMVMKFNPQGLVTMVLGRKDEAIDYLEKYLEEGRPHHRRRQRQARCRRRSRRQLRPADRRHLGHAGQHLRRRRLRQLARRQVHQGRRFREVDRLARQRSPVSSTRRTRSPPTPRATSTSAIAATAGSRCSTRT